MLPERLPAPPALALLDPWQPRHTPISEAQHPPAISRYYELLRNCAMNPYAGKVNIICAEQGERLPICLEWWGDRLGPSCKGYVAAGNHLTYLRDHQAGLAATLGEVLQAAAQGETVPAPVEGL